MIISSRMNVDHFTARDRSLSIRLKKQACSREAACSLLPYNQVQLNQNETM